MNKSPSFWTTSLPIAISSDVQLPKLYQYEVTGSLTTTVTALRFLLITVKSKLLQQKWQNINFGLFIYSFELNTILKVEKKQRKKAKKKNCRFFLMKIVQMNVCRLNIYYLCVWVCESVCVCLCVLDLKKWFIYNVIHRNWLVQSIDAKSKNTNYRCKGVF